MPEMNGKTAVVTGAGSGIGRATARRLAADRVTVVVADLDEAAADDTARSIAEAGGAALPHRCDVTDSEDVAALFARIQNELGGLDLAVNNAGICTEVAPLADYRRDQVRRMLSVNVLAVFNCLQHEVTLMRERGAGSIVNLSSIFGLVSGPGYAGYTATKHAVEGLTKAVALENADHGIRVNCVRPSVVQTPLMTGKDVNLEPGGPEWVGYENANPMGRFAQPEEIADAIAWLLSEETAFVSGGGVNLDGAYLAR